MLFKVSYQRAEHMFVAVFEYPHLVSSQRESFMRTSVTVASAIKHKNKVIILTEQYSPAAIYSRLYTIQVYV